MYIGDVIEQLDVDKSVIYFYDRIGLVPIKKEKHGKTWYRVFTEKNLIDLDIAIKMRDCGYGIDDTKVMLDGKDKELKAMLKDDFLEKIKMLEDLGWC
jgi:DNA-binding transcriptional MerR regulator